jgi:hypothetical protein
MPAHETTSDTEKIIFDVSLAVYTKIIRWQGMTGACYRMSLFLTEYLRNEHNIKVYPIVGYVNDGTDNLMISHAWVTYDGKITDINLIQTEPPIPNGHLRILDQIIERGDINYTYHLQETAASIRELKRLMSDPRAAQLIRHKQLEHQQMEALVRQPGTYRSFLDVAPDGLTYVRLTHLVRS